MFDVTREALDYCAERADRALASKCVRFVELGRGFTLSLDVPRSGDDVLRHEGRPVIAIPSESSDRAARYTLDVAQNGSLFLI